MFKIILEQKMTLICSFLFYINDVTTVTLAKLMAKL